MHERTRFLTLAVVVVVLLGGGIAYASATDDDRRRVSIDQAYFVTSESGGADINLTARLFASNRGFLDSPDLRVQLFVVPSHTGLATYETLLELGEIPGGRTREVHLPVTIHAFNASRVYRIDFLVFTDGLLALKGSGSLGWNGYGYYEADAVKGSADVASRLIANEPTFQRVDR